MFEKLQRAVASTARASLHGVQNTILQANLTGLLSDEQAASLLETIQQRYRSNFDPRPRRRREKLTDRKRLHRRQLANSGPLPSQLAAYFTTCELAVLAIVTIERGRCECSIKEISDRAGVGHSTVQKALRLAEKLGLLRITERRVAGRKNLPNIVEVISRDWLAWIVRGGSKKLKPLDTEFINPCNSTDSNPHSPQWKRLISRTSPGRFAIQSHPRR